MMWDENKLDGVRGIYESSMGSIGACISRLWRWWLNWRLRKLYDKFDDACSRLVVPDYANGLGQRIDKLHQRIDKCDDSTLIIESAHITDGGRCSLELSGVSGGGVYVTFIGTSTASTTASAPDKPDNVIPFRGRMGAKPHR